ncbi:chromosome partitioning protein ParA [Mycobacterium sp. ACS4331]|nr:chromosome partitioning protein ParA [Mycobacterium sp. ACS4331]
MTQGESRAAEDGARHSAPEPERSAGFRAEQRFAAPSAPAHPSEPDWNTATPATGIPVAAPHHLGAPHYGPPAGPAPGAPPAGQHPGAPFSGPQTPPVPQYQPAVPQSPYPDLSTHALLRPVKPAPARGWRRALYLASGKLINLGESAKETHHRNLVAHVNRPLSGCYKIAVLSLKGGVGKTTITATLGATFASIRGDRVIAVDANPDRGTLSQKVALQTPATVRDLLRDADRVQRYSDVRRYTSQGPNRLEVLASDSDPAVSEAFSSPDYTRTLDVLERFYSLVLTDCGTGLMHSAMSAVLAQADTLIVVSSGSVDGARSASATLDWLDAHGHEALVRGSVCVINAVRPRSGKVDMQKVVDHFSRRCRAVRQVPFDPHLEEGAEISLDRLKPSTREALLDLAAVVADGFPADFGPGPSR